jgi:hypothetical protein
MKKKLNKSKKLRVTHFVEAAEIIDSLSNGFCCNALSVAADTKWRRGYRGEKWMITPEREFFTNLFDTGINSFNHLYWLTFGTYSYDYEEMKEIRLLALCFAYEAAKDWNKRLTKRGE